MPNPHVEQFLQWNQEAADKRQSEHQAYDSLRTRAKNSAPLSIEDALFAVLMGLSERAATEGYTHDGLLHEVKKAMWRVEEATKPPPD